jgi:pyruvate dehydrogenase E2 component (dihydrolipoamide acetyltransferase)
MKPAKCSNPSLKQPVMATEVTLPDLGDGIESGDVLEVFVSVGEVITEGQDIVEM